MSSTPLQELIPYSSRFPIPKFAYVTAYYIGLIVIGVRKYIGLCPI